ncbi:MULTISPECIES: hypothetical protein [unclassified Pseudomonas]|uniref:hypothetical protein n=1 Tax=unclassified Pseudomonas TaxID=196821 RepID=UPI001F560124|nr:MULTISPECIES: hypothetical protein [unclassified Pseudomonas]
MELKFYQTAGGTYPERQLFHAIGEVNSDQEDAERYQLYVCSVLDAIAQVPEDCDRLLAAISSVEAGVQASITDGGNDVLLNMSDEGVQVDILVNDDWTGLGSRKAGLRCRSGGKFWSNGSGFSNCRMVLTRS